MPSDTILHEYGHTVQYEIYGWSHGCPTQEAVCEGWPSYFAATINDDAQFANYRNLDSPTSATLGDAYHFAGALWDIRKAIGAADADDLIWYATDDWKPDNTSAFFNSLLVTDDDPLMGFGGNADLSDGTPHSTDIWQAFFNHDMDYDTVVTLSDDSPLNAKLESPDDDDVFRFGIPGSKFAAIGIRPPSGDDFDLYVYSDLGLSSQVDYSNRGSGKVDFVVLGDGEAAGDYYALVDRFSGSGYYQVEMENSVGTIGGGTIPGSFAYPEVLDVYQINLNAGTEYEFKVTPTSFLSSLDVDIYLYSGTGGSYDEVNKSDAYGADDTETFTYTPSSTGYYGIVITDENDAYGDYTLEITTPSCVDTTPPPIPTLYDPGGTITVSDYPVDWSDVVDDGPTECRGISHYELQEDDSSSFPSPVNYTTGDSYRDFYSKPNGTYYYRVRAVDNAGNPSSGWSGWQDITVDVPPPPPPPPPTPKWSLIDDFASESGTAYEGDGSGESWGDWTYYDYWTESEYSSYVTKVSTKGSRNDVGRFYFENNALGYEGSRQYLVKSNPSGWDFSYPSDSKWIMYCYNENTVYSEDMFLRFIDSGGLEAETLAVACASGTGWQILEFDKPSSPVSFNWANVTKVWMIAEKGSDWTTFRDMYFDDLGWEMDVYLESSRYVVDPGEQFILRLYGVNKFSDTEQMFFSVDGEYIGNKNDPIQGETYRYTIGKSHSIPGTYTHTGEVDYNLPPDVDDIQISSNPVEIIVIDNIPPVVDITTPQEGANLSIQSVSVEWSGSDIPGIDHYKIKLDTQIWINKSTATSHTFTGVTEGLHTVYVKAVDGADNSATDSVGFRVDLTAPPAPVPSATPSTWTSTNSFSIDWTDPSDASGITGAYYKLDSLPTSDTDGTWTTSKPIPGITVSGDGSYPIYVWLKDGAGNVDYNNRGSTTLNYDGTAPSAPTNIVWQDGQYSTDTTITADWGDAADVSGIVDYYLKVDVDSTDFTAGLIFNGYVGSSISSKTLTSADGIADGHTLLFRVKAKNGAGLVSSTWSAVSASVTVDTTLPTVENSNTSDIMYGEDETVKVDAYDLNGVDTVILRLDSTTDYGMVFASGNTYTVTIPAAELTGGTHSIRYYVNDTADNMNSGVTDSFEVIVDNTPPTIVITSPENITYNTSSVDLNYSVGDESGIDWVGYSLDGQDNVTLIANVTLIELSEGAHNVTVYTNDTAGNVNSSAVYFTVKLPVHNLDTGLNYSTIQAAIDAVETLSGHTILVDAGTYNENVDVTKSINIVGDGASVTIVSAASLSDHVFEITANSVNISGFTVRGATSNSYAGIYLYLVSYADISNNNVSNNYNGIYLVSSSSSTLTNNTASSNNYRGIYLESSSSNTLTNNNVSNNYNGIYLESSSNGNTLTNNTASNNDFGIVLAYSSNNTLTSNTANSNTGYGIGLWSSSSNNTLTSNTANSNTGYGITLGSSSNNTLTSNTANSNTNRGIYLYSSSNNTIYNNFFNNTENIIVAGTIYANDWNTTKTPGTNIIGGPYLGGNFWAYPNGTGFSETCTDADGDGICDSNYTLASNNVDYLPLSLNFTTDATPPTYSNLTPPNNSYTSDFGQDISIVIIDEGSDVNAGSLSMTVAGDYYDANSGKLDYDTNSGLLTYYAAYGEFTDGQEVNVIARARDNAGNLLEVMWSFTVTIAAFVDSCTVISEPGIYKLTQDIPDSSASTCMNITAGNVTFDGQGYTIDGIDSSSTGIYVGESNVTIKNAKLTDWVAGIVIFKSRDNTVVENNLSSNYYGIYLSFVASTMISNNDASNNDCGIRIEYLSSDNRIHNNSVSSNDCGIGILGLSHDNKVSNNTLSSNTRGILIDRSSNNTIIGNNAENNLYGIHINSSTHIVVNNNKASHNYYGVYLALTENSTIFNNSLIYNTDSGIMLGLLSSNNSVFDNVASHNNFSGIGLVGSNENVVYNNSVSYNVGYGIWLAYSNNNKLAKNDINFNNNGIYLYNSNTNSLAYNNASSSVYGIYINESIYNLVYNNYFSNFANAVDTGIGNYWNVTLTLGTNVVGGPYLGGNFWAKPDGTGFSETCTDANSDGICDSYYNLASGNIDYLPLAKVVGQDFTPPTYSGLTPPNNSYTSDFGQDISIVIIDEGSDVNAGSLSMTVAGDYYDTNSGKLDYDTNSGLLTYYAVNGEFNAGQAVYVVVNAEDAVGNQMEVTWSFTVTSAGYTISLNQGWNLVSIPLEQGNWSITSVLASIEGNYTAVFAYIDGSWKYTTARNPLTEMDLEHGYWIEMTAPDILELTGTVPPATTINITTGWNLVGYPSLTTRNITDVLSGINYTAVFAYIDGTWKYTTARNPLTEMTPGYGYWIDSNEATSYEVRN